MTKIRTTPGGEARLRAAYRPGTHYRTELFSTLDVVDRQGLVVDVGGRDGTFLATVGVANGVVVDTDVTAREPSVRYLSGSGLDLPLASGCADSIISFDVIEHVADDRRFVAELIRIAKPGARIVLTTPNATIRVLPGRLQSLIDRSWGHHRVRGYEPAALVQLFNEAGVSDIEVMTVAMRWYRRLYFPLRALWSLPGPVGPWLVSMTARWDGDRLEGDRGFCLVVAHR
ncbi:MAG: methyltransferase domain-containing protein [Actinomycetia bacterium]|nr:methyltransferase domain-containing protein [Actinomycetes bacterium]